MQDLAWNLINKFKVHQKIQMCIKLSTRQVKNLSVKLSREVIEIHANDFSKQKLRSASRAPSSIKRAVRSHRSVKFDKSSA